MKLRNLLFTLISLPMLTYGSTASQLKKTILEANLTTFEAIFNAHKINATEKENLAYIASSTRALLQAKYDSMADHSYDIMTCAIGFAEGAIGVWALYKAIELGITLPNELLRLQKSGAVICLGSGILTIWAFYGAMIHIPRGFSYKQYLKIKIDNLDVMLEYLS